MSHCCPTFSSLHVKPPFVGPLFGRTCQTCLNPPLEVTHALTSRIVAIRFPDYNYDYNQQLASVQLPILSHLTPSQPNYSVHSRVPYTVHAVFARPCFIRRIAGYKIVLIVQTFVLYDVSFSHNAQRHRQTDGHTTVSRQ